MQRLQSSLDAYVATQAPMLSTTYDWDFEPAIPQTSFGITVAGNNWMVKNLDLKEKLAQAWGTANPSQLLGLAHYYVVIWGGIRAIQMPTLQRHLALVTGGGGYPIDGIASWSKIATISDPTRYAIFDARVAFSLNALQVLSGLGGSNRFPKLSSRNGVIKRVGEKLDAYARRHAWPDVPRSQVYPLYLKLLGHAAGGIRQPMALARAEMVLFAMAEALALAVEPHL